MANLALQPVYWETAELCMYSFSHLVRTKQRLALFLSAKEHALFHVDILSFQLMVSSSASTVTTSGADDITLMDFKLLGIRVKQLSRISGHGSFPTVHLLYRFISYNNG
jgi:hypothetical protein